MAWIGKFVSHIQRNVSVIAGIGVATVLTLSMTPQTLGLSKYQNLLRHFQDDGSEFPVDKQNHLLIDKVLQRILLRPEEEANFEFFISVLSDPVHLGSVKMKFGAVIGLPTTFTYTNIEEVDTEKFTIGGRSLDWDTDAGQELLKSIVLSDKAKAFAVAREIHYASSYHLHVDSVMRSCFSFVAYYTGHVINRRFNLIYRLKLWARLILYSLIASSWFVLYLTLNDTYSCFLDNASDRKTAKLTKLYAEGGAEYYSKVLSRNKALRVLMGSNGSSSYTVFGNEVSTWRQKHVQLTTRKDNLIKYCKEYEQM